MGQVCCCGEKTTSVSGTLVFDPAGCAHLPGNELKIDCLRRLLISALMLMIDSLTLDHTEVYSVPNNCFSSQVFFHCPSMQRVVIKPSSSSVDLDSSSLDDVRAKRAAIALSLGLSWPPDRHARSRGRPSWQQLLERALQEHILHHLSFRTVSVYSGRTAVRPSPDR